MKIKNLKSKIKNLSGGFTLIELMIVITIIAILATIVLFGLGQAQKGARDTQRESIVKGVQVALQAYAGNNGGAYPAGANWNTVTAAMNPLYLPDALNDPGCGTSAGGARDVRGLDTPLYGGCTGVRYTYTTTVTGNCLGAPYQMTINKESGGVGIFCGPK
ncbi:MAG: hypothetical protein UY21_C0009G0081 [Microgenomates group bacterium GW2011_GWA1_48_10]|nr:MAG: hypothetical protein UY21_C0009G0081 [Microgenomates group bacterium GW2011_GWA1_48_10]